MCHSFQYFGPHIEIFWKSTGIVYQLYHLLRIDADPDKSDSLVADPIRIRKNDEDPNRSESTTLVTGACLGKMYLQPGLTTTKNKKYRGRVTIDRGGKNRTDGGKHTRVKVKIGRIGVNTVQRR
jgi:hypothetical protein